MPVAKPALKVGVTAAERKLLRRPQVVIPAEHWAEFQAWAQRPARTVPALQALAATKPAWQD